MGLTGIKGLVLKKNGLFYGQVQKDNKRYRTKYSRDKGEAIKMLHSLQFELYGEVVKSEYELGYEDGKNAARKDAEKLVEALRFECGDRCAEQNPCNAKQALAEWENEA